MVESDGEVKKSSFKQDLDKAKKFIYDQGVIQGFVPNIEENEFDKFVEQNYDNLEVEESPLKAKKISISPSKSSVKSPV